MMSAFFIRVGVCQYYTTVSRGWSRCAVTVLAKGWGLSAEAVFDDMSLTKERSSHHIYDLDFLKAILLMNSKDTTSFYSTFLE